MTTRATATKKELQRLFKKKVNDIDRNKIKGYNNNTTKTSRKDRMITRIRTSTIWSSTTIKVTMKIKEGGTILGIHTIKI